MGGLREDDRARPHTDAEERASLLSRTIAAPIAACEVEAGGKRHQHAGLGAALGKAWSTVMTCVTARTEKPLVNGKIAIAVLTTLTLAAGIYLLFATSAGSSASVGDIRVALLADAHLIGPQYVCCTESNDVDNDSILKTVERLQEAQKQIEALSPPPAAVVFLGDVIHNGYYSHNFEWYLANRNAYTVGGEIFGNFSVPVRYLWGNHDYHTSCGSAADSYDRVGLSHRLFRRFLGPAAMPYSAMHVGRYTMLFLNAMLGPSWDPTHPRCDTRLASLGAEQLTWLAGELRSGRPTFVFMHHPLPAAMRAEAPELRHPDVLSVLAAHAESIMAVFSGHYHRGLDWREAYPFPHLTLPACRYDGDNWFLLNLPQEGPVRSWRVLDWDKNKGGARCSDTWTYPPAPAAGMATAAAAAAPAGGPPDAGVGVAQPGPAVPQPPETGSCGNPRLEEVGTFELAPVQKVDDVPGPTGHQFNPEPPCCLTFQRAFLERCLQEGATPECCAILGEHLRPSSAAYAASCMCWPPFWQQAQDTFRAAGRNATQLLESCAGEHGKSLQWPGRPGGSCMQPGSNVLPPPG